MTKIYEYLNDLPTEVTICTYTVYSIYVIRKNCYRLDFASCQNTHSNRASNNNHLGNIVKMLADKFNGIFIEFCLFLNLITDYFSILSKVRFVLSYCVDIEKNYHFLGGKISFVEILQLTRISNL